MSEADSAQRILIPFGITNFSTILSRHLIFKLNELNVLGHGGGKRETSCVLFLNEQYHFSEQSVFFSVSAFRIKKPEYYSHSFFSFFFDPGQSRMRRNFVQFVELNEDLGNACTLMQRAPLILYFLNITYKTGRDKKIPLSIFSGAVRPLFRKLFCLQGATLSIFDILQQPAVSKSSKAHPFTFFSTLFQIFTFCLKGFFQYTLTNNFYFPPAYNGGRKS